jgi:release factor glutamine methyltransferase
VSSPKLARKSATRSARDSKVTIEELVHTMSEIISGINDQMDAIADAREILSYLLDAPRSWPAFNGSATVTRENARRAIAAAEKRSHGAPIQYCAGLAAFRSLTLNVDSRVLIPRPETELLVEHVLSRKKTGVAVDLCTGSGAIALALATEGSYDQVIATDISNEALEVARGNAERYAESMKPEVEFIQGSALEPILSRRADVVVSNPPYIAFSELFTLDESVRDWEPSLALLAGDNGMAVIAEIVAGEPEILVDGGLLALEVDSRRAARAAELATATGQYRDISVLPDLTGRDRFVVAYKA